MQKTEKIYGTLPVDLGLIDLSPSEMMFWLYCPIKFPDDGLYYLPPNLRQFSPLVLSTMKDALACGKWYGNYVYITAKTLWTTPENPGNRPGWHSDGFLADDLNYIWCDSNPTIFFEDDRRHSFSADHKASLKEMDELCEQAVLAHYTYPVKHLLRLDQTVLHKVSTNINKGLRTFVKISISKHKYALRGNSINHSLDYDWEYTDRQEERNCPTGKV